MLVGHNGKILAPDSILPYLAHILQNGASLHITGHSLGGALAQFCTYELFKNNPGLPKSNFSLITWNALGGKAGLEQNLQNYDAYLLDGIRIEHYAHEDDVVARFGEDHVSGTTYLFESMDPSTPFFITAHKDELLSSCGFQYEGCTGRI